MRCFDWTNIPDFQRSLGWDIQQASSWWRHFTAEQPVSPVWARYPAEISFWLYKKYLLYPDAMPNAAHVYLWIWRRKASSRLLDSKYRIACMKCLVWRKFLNFMRDRNYRLNCQRFYDLDGFLPLTIQSHRLDCGGIVNQMWLFLWRTSRYGGFSAGYSSYPSGGPADTAALPSQSILAASSSSTFHESTSCHRHQQDQHPSSTKRCKWTLSYWRKDREVFSKLRL